MGENDAPQGDWSTWKNLVLKGLEDLEEKTNKIDDRTREMKATQDALKIEELPSKFKNLETEFQLFKQKVSIYATVLVFALTFILNFVIDWAKGLFG